MKKILFAANLESFFNKFLIPQLKYFKEQGYEVHIAAKLENLNVPYCDKKHDINFARSLNLKQNIESYKQMKKLFKSEHFDIVSCHTPFGGAITRLAFKNCKVKNTKMVYMAHGFHFYKGAPKFNWLCYYPVEKYLAKYTDTLITINLDDYELAKKKFKTDVRYVKGVGLDVSKFNFKMDDKEKKEYRKKLGLKNDDFIMIYPAELAKGKRQIWLINTLNKVLKEHKNFHILLPGRDSLNGKCYDEITKLKLQNQVHLLDFRSDVPELLAISDLAISSSNREGLPVNVMEAMYSGLPLVVTACRGNRDLIENGKNGYIVGINDSDEFCKRVLELSNLSDTRKKEIKEYDKKVIEQYLLDRVIEDIIEMYE